VQPDAERAEIVFGNALRVEVFALLADAPQKTGFPVLVRLGRREEI
jgi:hypothetical protein